MTDCDKLDVLGKYKATFTFIHEASDGVVYVRDLADIEKCSPSPQWVVVADHLARFKGKIGCLVDGMVQFEDGAKATYHPMSLRRATVEEIEKAMPKFTVRRQLELDAYSAAELLEAIGRKTAK